MGRTESMSSPAKPSPSKSSVKKGGSPAKASAGARPASSVPSHIQTTVDQLLKMDPMTKRLQEESETLAATVKKRMAAHGMRRIHSRFGYADLRARATTKTDVERIPAALREAYKAAQEKARECIGTSAPMLYKYLNADTKEKGRNLGESAVLDAEDTLSRLITVDAVRKRVDKAVGLLITRVKDYMLNHGVHSIDSAHGCVVMQTNKKYKVNEALIPADLVREYRRAEAAATVETTGYTLMRHSNTGLAVGGIMVAMELMKSLNVDIDQYMVAQLLS